MVLEVDGCGYRFLVLFFNCMLTFGSYFCFDMPSVLQSQFEGVENCTNITGEMNCTCVGCLGMTSTQYNLLYAIYFWTKFIKDKYEMDKTTSAYLAGAVFYLSMVLSPLLGTIIDHIGMRGIIAMLSALLTIPVFGLLAFTKIHPLVSTLWFGFTLSMAATSMWPSIPLVVPRATVGTAIGIITFIEMTGVGITNIIVGRILDRGNQETTDTLSQLLRNWQYVMIYMLANVLACVATSVSLNVIDSRKGGVLNESRKKRNQRLALTMEEVIEDTMGDDSETHNLNTLKNQCEAALLQQQCQ